MRQREVLNRLGEGNHTTEDIMKFKERMIEPTVATTPKMFFTCLYRMQRSLSSVIEHNVPYQVLKYSFKTKFSVIGAESQEPSHKFMKQIPSDPKKTKQLHSMPNVAVEEKTEISPHKIRR